MREALIRLAHEGLVEVIPRHGMRVLPVSPADMSEIYVVLTALESAAAEILAQRRPDATPSSSPLVDATRDMTRALEADDLDAWAAADERFHRHLVELAGNRTLIDAVARLADRAHRARMFTLRLRPKPVNSTQEHMAMLERIRAGDARGAVEVNRAHRSARASSCSRSSNAIDCNRCSARKPVTTKTTYDICVLPGDGIGVDVIDATLPLLDKLTHDAGFSLRFATHPAGAQHYAATGDALPAKTLEAARAADAILFGAMGWPAIRYPDGTEIAPQLDLRVELELYAGVRPARAIPGLPLPLADPRARQIDLVVVRESTEGLFASRGRGTIENDSEARDTMVITRKGCERVHDFAFRLAQRRKAKGRPGRVTCVDKANVFRSMAFFRKIFDERARALPRHRGAAQLHRRDRARPRPQAVGVRRARHREHVRRHPVRPDRGAGRRHGHGAVGRHRRPPRHVPAVPRLGARHRGPGQGQSDRDDPVRRR